MCEIIACFQSVMNFKSVKIMLVLVWIKQEFNSYTVR